MAHRSLDFVLKLFVIVGILSVHAEAAASLTCTYQDCSKFICRCLEGNASCPPLSASLEADFKAGKVKCLASRCVCGDGPSVGGISEEQNKAPNNQPRQTPNPAAGENSGKSGVVVPGGKSSSGSSEQSSDDSAAKEAAPKEAAPKEAAPKAGSAKSNATETPESSSSETESEESPEVSPAEDSSEPEESDEDDDNPCIDAELLKTLPERSYWIKSSNSKMLCPGDLPCVTPQHYFSDGEGNYVTARELCSANAGCTTKWGPVGAVVVDGVKKLADLGAKTDGSFRGKDYVLTPWAENDGLRGCQACMRVADSVIGGTSLASTVAVSAIAGMQGFLMTVVSQFHVSVVIALVLSGLSALSV